MPICQDVNALPPGDKTLFWYEKAVGQMRMRATADPLSWDYQRAVHGTTMLPPAMTGFWAECQHGTSFFLPWHRMYLYYFERIVRQIIKDPGGPPD
jgi:tyrosinase